MLTEEEITDARDTILSYIERLGDDVIDTHTTHTVIEEGDGPEEMYFQIHVEEMAHECKYVVAGRQKYDSFLLFYNFDLITALKRYIESQEGKKTFELDDFEVTNPEDAAKEIINRVDENDLERLSFQLHDHISNPITISSLRKNEDGQLRGFRVMRHLFPLEDSWGYPDYYDVLTAVTTVGEKGARYLANSFAIKIPESLPDEDLRLSFDPEDIFGAVDD